MPSPLMRTVVPDNDVRDRIDYWIGACPPFQDAWRALEWLLMRNPYVGSQYLASNPKVRLYKQEGFQRFGAPDIIVIYIVHANQIDIKSMKIESGGRDLTGIRPH